MKTKTLLHWTAFPVLAFVVLFWCGCYGPTLQMIEQPPVASPGDTVTIPIKAGQTGSMSAKSLLLQSPFMKDEISWILSMYPAKGVQMFPTLSICIPEGSELENPVPYRIDRDSVTLEGNLFHIRACDEWMNANYPPEPGYRWWSCIGDCPILIEDRDITLDPWMKLPTNEDEYFIDYFIGYEEDEFFDTIPGNFYPEHSQSFNHYLTTAEAEHYLVTSTASTGAGSLRMAMDSIANFGVITFDLDFPATITLTGAMYIDRPCWIKGPEDESLTIKVDGSILVSISAPVAPVKFSDLQFKYWGSPSNDNVLLRIHYTYSSLADFERVEFSNNDKNECDLIFSESNLSFTDCEFNNNEVMCLISAQYQTTRVENCIFTSNMENAPGTDLNFYYSDLEICNTVFLDSISPLYAEGSNVILKNISFAGYEVMFFYLCNLEILNSILWSLSDGTQVYVMNDNYNPLFCKVSYSDVKNWAIHGDTIIWLEGNISEEPLFTGEGDHWCSLQPGSPCIDAGTPDITGLGLPPWDLLGNNRVWDGDGDGIATVDMGAYEYGSVWVSTEEFKVQSSKFKVEVYPNPVKTSVTIQYSLDQPSRVEIMIYNHMGQRVENLYEGKQLAGDHTIRFDASSFPAGLYFVSFKTGNGAEVVKIIKM